MAERRFEFSDETSRKFWAIEVAGDTVTVRFGKIGTAGSPKDKVHASPEAAAKEAAKLIAEKTRKGYVETDAAPGAAPTPAKPPAAAKSKKKAGAAETATPEGDDALATTLAKLDAALQTYAPKANAARAGTTSFAPLEALVTVPAALRTLWGWTHGGPIGSGLFVTSLSDDGAGQWEEMLSVEGAAQALKMLRETADLPATLIPFATDGNGNFLVVDPAGAVLDWDHETRDPQRVSPSLARLLDRSLQAIKKRILFGGPEPGANVPNPAAARLEKLSAKIAGSDDPGGDLDKLVEVSCGLRDPKAQLEVLMRPHLRAVAAAARAHERNSYCSHVIELGVQLDRWDDVLAVAPLGRYYWTSLGDGAVHEGAMERALRCFEQAVANETTHTTEDSELEGHLGAAFACARLGRASERHLQACHAMIDAAIAASEQELAAYRKRPDPKTPKLPLRAGKDISQRLLYRATLAMIAGDEALAKRTLAERAKYDDPWQRQRHERIGYTIDAVLGPLLPAE